MRGTRAREAGGAATPCALPAMFCSAVGWLVVAAGIEFLQRGGMLGEGYADVAVFLAKTKVRRPALAPHPILARSGASCRAFPYFSAARA